MAFDPNDFLNKLLHGDPMTTDYDALGNDFSSMLASITPAETEYTYTFMTDVLVEAIRMDDVAEIGRLLPPLGEAKVNGQPPQDTAVYRVSVLSSVVVYRLNLSKNTHTLQIRLKSIFGVDVGRGWWVLSKFLKYFRFYKNTHTHPPAPPLVYFFAFFF